MTQSQHHVQPVDQVGARHEVEAEGGLERYLRLRCVSVNSRAPSASHVSPPFRGDSVRLMASRTRFKARILTSWSRS